MGRRNLIRTNLFPYHIVSRVRNKDWYDLPIHRVWKIYMDSFKDSIQRHPVNILAFVLMNNHFHLLIQTPDSNINQFMQ